MSEKTGIEWATHTASPWFGCSKVSAGCTNCYAETLTLQKKWAGWGDNSPRVRSKGFWKDPYKYNKKPLFCSQCGARFPNDTHQDICIVCFAARNEKVRLQRARMFTSLMDWLDPKAPIEWLQDFMKVILECKNLNWLLLTKRPELWRERINGCKIHSRVNASLTHDREYSDTREMCRKWIEDETPPENVWFGVTCENQEQLGKRWDSLRNIPARIKWASCEPLLEYLRLHGEYDGKVYNYLGKEGLNWIVVGGESGPNRRDCGVVAIESVARQCREAKVPCFVKQDVGARPGKQGRISDVIWRIKEYPVFS